MNRKSFLKSLLTIAVAPKVLTEVEIPVAPVKSITKVSMLPDLHYTRQLVDKYGSDNYALFMRILEQDGTPVKEFYHYEKRKS